MPQLRSFSAFAPTPDTGSAFVGGAGVGQRQQETAINAATARSQMSNQYAIAEMENAAKQQALQMEAMKAAQELEVQRSYQQQSLALKSQELEQGQQEFQMKSDQAAREAQAQAMYQSDVASMMKAGKSPAEATATAVAKYGLAMGDRAATPMEGVIRGGAQRAQIGPNGQPVAFPLLKTGGESTGRDMVQTGPETFSFVPEKGPASQAPLGYMPFTDEKGMTHIVPDLKYRNLAEEVKTKSKDLNNIMGPYAQGIQAARVATTGSGNLTVRQKADLKKYLDAVDEYKALRERLDNYDAGGFTPPTTAPAAGGGSRKPVKVLGVE